MSLPNTIRTRLATALLCAGALASVTGCTATVTARPARAELYSQPVVYVDEAPPGIYEYPSTTYHGRPAYLVGARWYYPADGGWVYFRDEPIELRDARTSRRFVRVHSDTPRRVYVEERPVRRHYVEKPTETRRRRYD